MEQGVCVGEGGARLFVSKLSFENPHRSTVFFNPRMSFSRSAGSLAIAVLKPKSVLDGLCSTGARGVRYAKENPCVKKLSLVDANPLAFPFIRKNLSLNGLSSKAKAFCQDFNDFCFANENAFDFVEIDPFGTPAPFVESALLALKKPGVLSFTSTDLANVVKKNAPTLRDYDAKPLYCDFSHENALRILLGFVARKAGEARLRVTPLLCFYEGHHVKIVVRVERRKLNGRRLGFISYCDKCLRRFEGKRAKCVCSDRLLYAGPLWLGAYCDKKFLHALAALNEKRDYAEKKRIAKTLFLLSKEPAFPPWFYDVHSFADHYALAARKKMESILEELRAAGFKAERTHFTPTGVKTNAGMSAVKRILSR
ncbi:MAG: hypothetical protein QXR53_04765 [Candidatus Norongarragalinales archaeon]